MTGAADKLARTAWLLPWGATLIVLTLLAGCTTPPPDDLASSLPFESALSTTMREVSRSEEPPDEAGARPSLPEIIYIRDRHSLTPGYHRLRPQLAAVQRDNRRLVDYLVGRGYGLLGCEFRFGPLQEEPATQRQYKIVRSRLKFDDSNAFDGFSIFQAIRHQIANQESLQVWGVEDRELYDEDVGHLHDYRQATRYAKRRDLTPEQKDQALTAALKAAKALDENLVTRGEAAVNNLLKAMRETGETRAILILGGSHLAGVRRALEASGRSYRIVESPNYHELQIAGDA